MKHGPLHLAMVCAASVLVSACTSGGDQVTQTSPEQISQEQTDGANAQEAHEPFHGVCYHPVPKGETQLSFDRLDEDLALMKEAGINTIRVYVPVDDEEVLNKIADAGMQLAVGFGYNQDGFYDIVSGSFLDYVRKYKDHPAIYLWELGNEYNYHPEWFDGDIKNWYVDLEHAVDSIHAIDPNHGVSTVHGELPDSMALYHGRNLDIWGFNVYRWDLPGSFIEEWVATSDKPFYFGEVGADSYMTVAKDGFDQGVNESAQAQAVGHILDEIYAHKEAVTGVMVFSFTDGWWKAGNPATQDVGGWAPNSSGVPYDGAPNEEYWGIVDIDRNKKLAFEEVKNRFNPETQP